MASKEYKRCGRCGETKPLHEFGNRSDRPCGKRSTCKQCANAYNRSYFPAWRRKPENRAKLAKNGRKHYDANKGRILERHREWRKANPDLAKHLGRKGSLRREYGLTLEQFGVMLGQQEGLCAICCAVITEERAANIDHCHDTGKVRALLCGDCNRGIGLLRDDASRVHRAAQYLEFHKSRPA